MTASMADGFACRRGRSCSRARPIVCICLGHDSCRCACWPSVWSELSRLEHIVIEPIVSEPFVRINFLMIHSYRVAFSDVPEHVP